MFKTHAATRTDWKWWKFGSVRCTNKNGESERIVYIGPFILFFHR